MTLSKQEKRQIAIAIQLATVAIIGVMAGISLLTIWIGAALLIGLLVFQTVWAYTVIDNMLNSKQPNPKTQDYISELEECRYSLQSAIDTTSEYLWVHNLIDRRLYPPDIARDIQKRIHYAMEHYYEEVGQPKLPLQYGD